MGCCLGGSSRVRPIGRHAELISPPACVSEKSSDFWDLVVRYRHSVEQILCLRLGRAASLLLAARFDDDGDDGPAKPSDRRGMCLPIAQRVLTYISDEDAAVDDHESRDSLPGVPEYPPPPPPPGDDGQTPGEGAVGDNIALQLTMDDSVDKQQTVTQDGTTPGGDV
eukprot:Hpha_TRINITY_DN5302_c0_g2::TRINITY_DN5302_c0_g2_i1::g.32803::m.32803